MASYRTATSRGKPVPGVYVRHIQGCPAEDHDGPRCRCEPSYRGKRRDLGWSPTYKSLAEAQEWKASAGRSAPVAREYKADGPTFRALAAEWWEGVQSGSIAKRRGASAYSATTLHDYGNSLNNFLLKQWGNRPAAGITTEEWQSWVDSLARKGNSRSRIVTHLAVVRAVYGWASRPSRRLVPTDPTRGLELPPNDEKPRMRVANAEEAAKLLAALDDDDRLAYALAFYAGLRRSEIDRLMWSDLFLDVDELVVWKSKSRAGTNRRLPIAAPLKPLLKAAQLRQGRPEDGRVVGALNVTSCGVTKRSDKAWGTTPEAPRSDTFERITLHECRHTYASFLMAARYTLSELMAFMGHSSLQATERYVKMLPQPREENRADRLNNYLAGKAM